MKKTLASIARIFLGLVFLAAGVNGYFVIFGLDPFIQTSPQAMQLFQFKYLLILEKSMEVLCAVLLLRNRFVPLALSLLTPIVANIFLLHLFVDHSLLLLATILSITHVYLLWIYKQNFVKIFEKKPAL
ncbi:putative membrane protein YphA (DoxX/SURF4 family) [Bacillus fengqiuensis]|nr:putative membrane protein YphA (DoxX/SURF4 family) [Bacillus fengqiuensis]